MEIISKFWDQIRLWWIKSMRRLRRKVLEFWQKMCIAGRPFSKTRPDWQTWFTSNKKRGAPPTPTPTCSGKRCNNTNSRIRIVSISRISNNTCWLRSLKSRIAVQSNKEMLQRWVITPLWGDQPREGGNRQIMGLNWGSKEVKAMQWRVNRSRQRYLRVT